MQDVNHQLFTESVLDEVLLSMNDENICVAEEILTNLNLIHLKEMHPMALSGGEKQRVAIASDDSSGTDSCSYFFLCSDGRIDHCISEVYPE